MARKREDFLSFIKEYSRRPNMECTISFDSELVLISKKLLNDMHNHFGWVDIRNKRSKNPTHQQLVYELLYFDDDKLSHEKIAEETHVKNIKYHIREFNKLALDFVAEESQVDSRYKILLEKYQAKRHNLLL